jgi:signal transduction histidine kinase
MRNFLNILKSLKPFHWVILFFVGFIGAFGTLAIGERLEDKAIQSWIRQAELDAAASTIAAQSWLAQSETIISGLALGFKNPNRITTDEFKNMVIQAEEWNSEFSLDAVAVVQRVSRPQRREMEKKVNHPFLHASLPGEPVPEAYDHMVVIESSETDGLLRPYVDLLTYAEMGNVVKTAWRIPKKAIMGPSFVDNDKHFTLVGIGVPEYQKETVIVGRVNLSDMIDVLMANHVPDGIVLRLSERGSEADADTPDRSIFGSLKPANNVLHTLTIRITRGQARWTYNWDVTKKYLGGAPKANATMVQIGGLIITILVVYSIGALSVQNTIIRRTVAERTQNLTQEAADRREAEEALRRSQKMEAVGQLTGGIAHDFNNLLGVIMGNLQIIQLEIEEEKTLADNNKLNSWINAALRNADRGVGLTQSLLKFSRKEASEAKVLSINALVGDIDNLLRKSLTRKIEVHIDLAHDLWLTEIDSSDFADTLTNLVLNARDAMAEGGRLNIKTYNTSIGDDHSFMNEEAVPGDFVCMEVEDTGTGISLDILDNVFEPFFTTKESGRGTGLGLSMVFGFVRRSAGDITIKTTPGHGTTFRVYLPKASVEGVDNDETDAADIVSLRGSETVLVVDDEENMLEVATVLLSGLGYKTLASSDGVNALAVLNENRNIDLLFTDVVMPGGIDGFELAKRARNKYPALKILLTSGFAGEAAFQKSGIDLSAVETKKLISSLLEKPYLRNELASSIRRVLDGEA